MIKRRNLEIIFIGSLMILFTSYCMQYFWNPYVLIQYSEWLLCLVGSFVVTFIMIKYTESRWDALLLGAGYYIRVFVLFVDIYAKDRVTIFCSGADSEVFFDWSIMCYEEGYVPSGNKYPDVLYLIYKVIGPSRLQVQYLNVLFWVGTAFLIYQILRQCKIRGIAKYATLLFCCFSLVNVCMSGILLRESSMIFFDTAAFYCLIQWMRHGKAIRLIVALVSVFLAICLHPASVMVLCGGGCAFLFWSRSRKKYRINMVNVVCVLLGLLVMAFLYIRFHATLFSILPSKITLESLTNKYFDVGDSDYLTNMKVDTWGQFFVYTLIRMFYFICAPVPWEWRGLKDIVAFMGDGFPILFFIIFSMYNAWRYRKNETWIGILIIVLTMFIFSWGTANAGTAMRHRDLIFGVILCTYCISQSREEEDNAD